VCWLAVAASSVPVCVMVDYRFALNMVHSGCSVIHGQPFLSSIFFPAETGGTEQVPRFQQLPDICLDQIDIGR
jgi:hypothetical protein